MELVVKRKKLGSVQKSVLCDLERHGWWSASGHAGWVWDNTSGTERIMRSLVRAGYAVVAEESGRGLVYRPRPAGSIKVFLHDGTAVDGNNPLAMLERQYRILMQLSRNYKDDERIQDAIADANILGLEVVDRLKEAEESKL
jgi:hypothetical protein